MAVGWFTQQFVPMLVGWSSLWMIGSAVGLWVTPERGFWRAFCFMTALWTAINCAIGAFALLFPPDSAGEFRRLLLLNAGLGVGYIATGIVLVTRKRPILRGFGVAVLVQAVFLLAFDLTWWGLLRG